MLSCLQLLFLSFLFLGVPDLAKHHRHLAGLPLTEYDLVAAQYDFEFFPYGVEPRRRGRFSIDTIIPESALTPKASSAPIPSFPVPGFSAQETEINLHNVPAICRTCSDGSPVFTQQIHIRDIVNRDDFIVDRYSLGNYPMRFSFHGTEIILRDHPINDPAQCILNGGKYKCFDGSLGLDIAI